jgi:hypothetical protein
MEKRTSTTTSTEGRSDRFLAVAEIVGLFVCAKLLLVIILPAMAPVDRSSPPLRPAAARSQSKPEALDIEPINAPAPTSTYFTNSTFGTNQIIEKNF